ncbi:MAG: cupin domain-containing protein, partial [Methyloceanibacter sp.]
MSLKPGEDIGEEVHQLDQLLRLEEGEGKAVLDGIEHRIKPGFAILVPAYAPPNHRDGVV